MKCSLLRSSDGRLGVLHWPWRCSSFRRAQRIAVGGRARRVLRAHCRRRLAALGKFLYAWPAAKGKLKSVAKLYQSEGNFLPVIVYERLLLGAAHRWKTFLVSEGEKTS